MNKQVRNRYPKLAIYKTHWLRLTRYWARIDTMEDAARFPHRSADQRRRVAV